jgi:hypothetical protein
LAQDYFANIHSLSENRQIDWKIEEYARNFYFFGHLLCLDPVFKFPESTKKPGYFVGLSDDLGDVLTFKILKNVFTKVLHRSVV